MIPYQNLAYPDKYEHQYTRSGVYQSNVFLWCDYSIQPYEKNVNSENKCKQYSMHWNSFHLVEKRFLSLKFP